MLNTGYKMKKYFKTIHKARQVNDKKLLNAICQTIDEVANEYIITKNGLIDFTYDYSILVEFLEVYFAEELLQNKHIQQYDIICDDRNNDPLEVRKGTIHLTIRYVQFDCLNTTQIDYTFYQ